MSVETTHRGLVVVVRGRDGVLRLLSETGAGDAAAMWAGVTCPTPAMPTTSQLIDPSRPTCQ